MSDDAWMGIYLAGAFLPEPAQRRDELDTPFPRGELGSDGTLDRAVEAAERLLRCLVDELSDSEYEAYSQGYADAALRQSEALGTAALAAGLEGQRRYGDGFWDGFAEGLLARPGALRRRYGLGRAHRPRALTRPPVCRAVRT